MLTLILQPLLKWPNEIVCNHKVLIWYTPALPCSYWWMIYFWNFVISSRDFEMVFTVLALDVTLLMPSFWEMVTYKACLHVKYTSVEQIQMLSVTIYIGWRASFLQGDFVHSITGTVYFFSSPINIFLKWPTDEQKPELSLLKFRILQGKKSQCFVQIPLNRQLLAVALWKIFFVSQYLPAWIYQWLNAECYICPHWNACIMHKLIRAAQLVEPLSNRARDLSSILALDFTCGNVWFSSGCSGSLPIPKKYVWRWIGHSKLPWMYVSGRI